jgi:cytochrome c oxidase cbb3-type subunit 3
MTEKRIDEPTGTSTVGHEWDGIEELDTPLPRWWLLTFYACIVFSIGYVIVYPAIPLVHGATQGLWGWTSRGTLTAEMRAEQAKHATINAALAATPLDAIVADANLRHQAIEGGKAYPNLNDDDWLWGGDVDAIYTTISHGVRQSSDSDSRMSQMPAFGSTGILKPAEVQDVVSYVRTISKQDPADAASARGAMLFTANCAVCHGPDGKGNRTLGAPNLTDQIWLYGGDRASLTETVTNAHYGQMPNWGAQLDPVTIKMLAVYVHSLGGGEKTAAPTAPAAK